METVRSHKSRRKSRRWRAVFSSLEELETRRLLSLTAVNTGPTTMKVTWDPGQIFTDPTSGLTYSPTGHYTITVISSGPADYGLFTINTDATETDFTGLHIGERYVVFINESYTDNTGYPGNVFQVATGTVTDQLPPPPVQDSPSDGSYVVASAANNIELSWQPVEGASGYQVDVGTDPQQVSNDLNSLPAQPGYTSTSANLTLAPNTKYYWTVRGYFGSNTTTGWSPVKSFTVLPPFPPQLLSPINGDQVMPNDQGDVVLQWEDLAPGVGYQMDVEPSLDQLNKDLQTLNPLVTWTTSEADLPLTPGATYYWAVRGIYPTGGVITNWSSVGVFNLVPRPPADLTGQLSNLPASVPAGGTIKPVLQISNAGGTQAAIGNTLTQYYLSPTAAYNPKTVVPLGSVKSYLNLPGGSSTTSQPTLAIPADTKQGTYYLLGLINSAKTVIESNYKNDTAIAKLEVGLPQFKLTEATTIDSNSVTINYAVSGVDSPNMNLAIYRSSIPMLIKGNYQLLGTAALTGNQLAVGSHRESILQGVSLPPNTKQEYIIVQADPGNKVEEAAGSVDNVYFQKFVLGAVSHGFTLLGGVPVIGGIPEWETHMARDLLNIDHYNHVIEFDWTLASGLPFPGETVKAGNQLYKQILSSAQILASSHSGDVVDLELIGHSRGTDVVNQAIKDLQGTKIPWLMGNYISETLLDPHPANVQTISLYSSGLLGVPAAAAYKAFSTFADDPIIAIPSNVDSLKVYYQKTSYQLAAKSYNGPTDGLINLWDLGPGDIVVPPTLSNVIWNSLTNVYDGYLYNNNKIGYIGHNEGPLWYVVHMVDRGLAV